MTIHILFLALGTFIAGIAAGASVEGVIGGSGSHINYRVTIKEKGKVKHHKICQGAIADEINQYHRMTARVEYVQNKKKCLTVSKFTLLKTPSGKEPFLGTLVKEGNSYSLKTKDQTYKIENAPKKLQKMVTKEVVCDLEASTTKQGKAQGLYYVLYFAPAPKG